MRVLIIGATGLLGRALLKEWDADEVVGVGSREADIRDQAQVRQLLERHWPDWTVLAAAYTDVDGCETNPERAYEVNCNGAVNVARECGEAGSRLLLLSSDYVFDGSKCVPYEVDDAISPLSVYGRTKANAEAAVRGILPDSCIVRTSWLFGAQGRCFPNTILKLAEEKRKLSVVEDQRGCPTFNRDLARGIAKLTRLGATGTVHLTNIDDCSWYELALALVETTGLADVVVQPIRTQDLLRPAPRPKYSALSPTSARRFGIAMRSWRETIQEYLDERRAGLPEITSFARLG